MSLKLRTEFLKTSRSLIGMGWKTPNTYGCDFGQPGPYPAVYLFLNVVGFEAARVLYVGMSRSVSDRLAGHPVMREILDRDPEYVQTWFKPTDVSDLRAVEKSYIEMFDPPLNVHHRPRSWWAT